MVSTFGDSTPAGPQLSAVGQVARSVGGLLQDGTGPKLIVELTAGGLGAVASNFADAAELIDACDGNPRLAFCVDSYPRIV